MTSGAEDGAMSGDFKARERLVLVFSSGDWLTGLTHSIYVPLWPLITSLAATLVVDSHWLPKSNVRKRPEYICEAFQRLILGFIVSERSKDFMTCRVDNSLRQVYGVAQSQALSTTPSQERYRLERESEAKHPSGKCKSTYLVLMCLETFFKSLLRQKVVRHFK